MSNIGVKDTRSCTAISHLLRWVLNRGTALRLSGSSFNLRYMIGRSVPHSIRKMTWLCSSQLLNFNFFIVLALRNSRQLIIQWWKVCNWLEELGHSSANMSVVTSLRLCGEPNFSEVSSRFEELILKMKLPFWSTAVYTNCSTLTFTYQLLPLRVSMLINTICRGLHSNYSPFTTHTIFMLAI